MNLMDMPDIEEKPASVNPGPDMNELDDKTEETQLDIADEGLEEEKPDPAQTELRECLKEYYWCKPTTECVQELVRRSSEYYQYITATGKMALWRLVFEQYNRGFITLGSVSRGGTEGELLNLPINEFRNIVDHVVGLTTADKLAFEPQAENNDYSTAAQITVSRCILNDYASNKGMDEICDHTSQNAYIFGEGSVLKLWNENIGDLKAVDEMNQRIFRQGDCQFIELNPTNLIRDINIQQFKDNQWFIARVFVNKYDLAAQYPDKARDICNKQIATDWDNSRITSARGEKTELIPLYIALHKPTSSVPFGRMIFYLDSDTWLEDGHLEYKDFPLYTNMPAPVDSINFGYTTAFDLLPLQQVIDILAGAIATNNTNFAVSNILVPEGCNLGVADLVGAMNLLKYDAKAGKPEALNLVMTPQEVYNLWDKIIQRMEVIAGINSTIRGQTDEKITSGIMAALYASQAIHFNSRFQKSHALFVGRLATGILDDLKDHPDDKRTGLVAGKGNQAYMKEFYGKDVNMIQRVTVSIGSAFARTDAGRVQMAQDLLNGPNGLDNKEYLEVIETGSLDPLTQGPHRELMLIKAENETLMNGGMCKAVLTDDHMTHVREHKNVIADPEMRQSNDPETAKVMTNTLTHIAEHEQLFEQLQSKRPVLAGLLGMTPPVPPNGAPPQRPQHRPNIVQKPMPGKPQGHQVMPQKPQAGPMQPQARRPLPRQKIPIHGNQQGIANMPTPAPAQPPAMAALPRT